MRTLDEVAEVCEHVRNYRETGYTDGGYVAFYHLGCGIIPHVENGEEHFYELALKHPRCTEAYAGEMRDAHDTRTGGMPSSCKNLDAKCGGDACKRSPFSSLGKNPLIIATEHFKRKSAPPPPAVDDEPTLIVEPPFPYTRTASGIRMTVTKTVKEVEIEENVLICPYDMFPFDACQRTELEQAFSMWAVKIPRQKHLEVVKITTSVITDTRALHTMLSDHGVHLTTKQIEKVKEMMIHYIRTVQEHQQANRQYDHLGWVDKAKTEFIMPTTLLNIDGTSKPTTLSAKARRRWVSSTPAAPWPAASPPCSSTISMNISSISLCS